MSITIDYSATIPLIASTFNATLTGPILYSESNQDGMIFYENTIRTMDTPEPGTQKQHEYAAPDETTTAAVSASIFTNAAAAAATAAAAGSQWRWRYSLAWTVLLCIAYAIVFILGLVGNSAVLFVIYTMHRNNTPNSIFAHCNNVFNYLICNLALADLLVIIFCLIPNLLGSILTTWILGRFICKAVPFLQGVFVSASIYTLVAISIDRYYGIYYPFNNGFSPFVRRNVIVFIWLFSLSITSPWLLYFDLNEINNQMLCHEIWPEETAANFYFLVVNIGLQYLLPVLVIIIFYVLLYAEISRRKVPMLVVNQNAQQNQAIELNKTISTESQTESSSVSRLPLNMEYSTVEKLQSRIVEQSKLKVLKMLIIIVSLFALSWLPLYILFCIIKFTQIDEDSFFGKIIVGLIPLAQWLGASNSCVNPILYFFFNPKFRAYLRKTIMGRRLFYFCLPLSNDKQLMGQYTTTAIPNTPTLGGNSRNSKNYYIVNYNATTAYNTRLTTATLLMTPRANHVLLQLEENKQDQLIQNGTSVIDIKPETNGLNMDYIPLSMNILSNNESIVKSNSNISYPTIADNLDKEDNKNDNRPNMTLQITRSYDLNQRNFNENTGQIDNNLLYQSNHYQHSHLNQTHPQQNNNNNNNNNNNKIKFNNKCTVSNGPVNHCHNNNNNKPHHNQNHYHHHHHHHHHYYYHHQKPKQQIGPIFSTIADDQTLNRETTL